jgi:hypothetical protein
VLQATKLLQVDRAFEPRRDAHRFTGARTLLRVSAAVKRFSRARIFGEYAFLEDFRYTSQQLFRKK